MRTTSTFFGKMSTRWIVPTAPNKLSLLPCVCCVCVCVFPFGCGTFGTLPVGPGHTKIGRWQLVELMAKVLGTTVDPSALLELQGDSQEEQGLSQMATQDN